MFLFDPCTGSSDSDVQTVVIASDSVAVGFPALSSAAVGPSNSHEIKPEPGATPFPPAAPCPVEVPCMPEPDTHQLSWLEFAYGHDGHALLQFPKPLQDTHSLIVWMSSQPEHVFVPVRAARISDLVRAECKLNPDCNGAKFTDVHGQVLDGDAFLVPGTIILVWWKWESWPLPRLPRLGWPDVLGLNPTCESKGWPDVLGLNPERTAESQGWPDVLGLNPITAPDVLEVAPVPVPLQDGDPVPSGSFQAARTPSVKAPGPYDPLTPQVSHTAAWTQGYPAEVETKSVDVVPLGPLLQLCAEQFLALKMPSIATPMTLFAVQAKMVTSTERIALLDQQGPVMADDELRFHLLALASEANLTRLEPLTPGVIVLDPLQISAWLLHPGETCAIWCAWHRPIVHAGSSIVTAIGLNGHWIPLQLCPQAGRLFIFTWIESSVDLEPLSSLLTMLAEALGFTHFEVKRDARAFSTQKFCGALAVAFASWVVTHVPLPMTDDELELRHAQLRKKHVEHLVSTLACSKPWLWCSGAKVSLTSALAQLLATHGVPESLSESRAATAIQVLGHEAVEIALKHKNPWRQLKVVGSQHRFQFLQPAELRQLVQANKQKDVGKKQGPKPRRGPAPPVALDPEKLQVVPGTFRALNQVMPQLAVTQLGPTATGYVLLTRTDAEPFLRAGNIISQEPLALVVLTAEAVDSSLASTEVTVPCRCSVNQEPLIVTAQLVQIGTHEVTKFAAPHVVMLDTLDVSTAKLLLFRDEIEDWDVVCQAPVKFIVSKLPCLSLCKISGCNCGGWHNPNALDLSSPLVDVWRRQWLSLTFRPAKASEAKLYSVSVRVPTELLHSLLALSGTAGIYIEPRSLDGKLPSDEYTVVWSRLPLQDLNHIKHTRPNVLGLARMQERRGLRVAIGDAKSLHESLHPGTLFMPGGPRMQFITGPWPYGCSRQSIQQTLAKFKWVAKPTQPTTQVPGRGNLWIVQAVDSPPDQVFQTDHGEILISVHKVGQPTLPFVSKPVAAPATLALCEASQTKVDDVLQHQDPWKNWNPSGSKPQPVAAPTVTDSMKQLENRIRTQVLASLPTKPPQHEDMERDDVPDRVVSLEDQVQKLITRQSSLETSVNDFTTRQSTQMQAMQTQINAQGQQIHGHIETSQQNIQAMFQSQMSEIRSLLAKRKDPSDWLSGAGVRQFQLNREGFVYCFCSHFIALFFSLVCWALCPLGFATSCMHLHTMNAGFSTRFWLPSSKRTRPFLGMRCVWICLLVLMQCRVGEAAHPGPPDQSFVIGCCNSSGLNGKAPMVDAHLKHGDLWAFSETHLSSRALHQFKTSLKFQKSPFAFCATGHNVPARAHSAVAGAYKGVAVLSKHPTRSIPASWPKDVQCSSRVMLSATYMFNQWLTVGVLYGEPEGPAHPRQRQHNEVLLHHLAAHICHLSVGLRIVTGDFNLGPDSIPAFQILRAAGFRDIQELARDHWGQPVRMTSKQRTLRDYCFLSPEMQVLLKDVQIIDDIWPDHAVLQATFSVDAASRRSTVWRQPQAFPWPRSFVLEQGWNEMSGSCDERYEQLWQCIEHSASLHNQPKVSSKCFGRGRCEYTKQTSRVNVAPLKPPRRGEIEPIFHGVSVQYAQWFRQARRLQSYLRHVQNRDDAYSGFAFQVWTSIWTAKGFAPDFSCWWNALPTKVVGAPDVLPAAPPLGSVAKPIFESVLLAVRQLEIDLKRTSRQYARFRRQKAPHLIFRDLKEQGTSGVDMLVKTVNATVRDILPDDCLLVLDQAVQWDDAQPVFCGGTQVEVLHQENENLWIANPEAVSVGDVVAQTKYTGDLDCIFSAFSLTWKERWQRHEHVPPSQWHSILDFAHRALPRANFDWPAMEAQDLQAVIRSKKARTSKGLDGVSLLDLKSLPLPILDEFCKMFSTAECTGEWPAQLVSGRVCALPKCDSPSRPDDFRPICVLGLLYRCWSSCQSRSILSHLHPTLPEGLFGSRPQCHASQVWHHLLWAVEAAHCQAYGLHGLAADLSATTGCVWITGFGGCTPPHPPQLGGGFGCDATTFPHPGSTGTLPWCQHWISRRRRPVGGRYVSDRSTAAFVDRADPNAYTHLDVCWWLAVHIYQCWRGHSHFGQTGGIRHSGRCCLGHVQNIHLVHHEFWPFPFAWCGVAGTPFWSKPWCPHAVVQKAYQSCSAWSCEGCSAFVESVAAFFVPLHLENTCFETGRLAACSPWHWCYHYGPPGFPFPSKWSHARAECWWCWRKPVGPAGTHWAGIHGSVVLGHFADISWSPALRSFWASSG